MIQNYERLRSRARDVSGLAVEYLSGPFDTGSRQRYPAGPRQPKSTRSRARDVSGLLF